MIMEHCLDVLAKRYPQILMPIEKGIKDSEEYRKVCLRGEKCNRPNTFSKDPKDKLETFNTPVGSVEVLTLRNRQDFEHACRCLGHKCEPVDIPSSTGAMAIFGLNNWDKVRAGIEDYKDSFIILSSGNYSDVLSGDIYMITNGQISLSEQEWVEKSIIIRKYHELTHFVMRKMYPNDIDFIRDELIADCVGLICAFKCFDIRLLKLFLGIESNTYRKGGRLENYEGFDLNNIEKILKMIDNFKLKITKYEDKDVNTIWNNIEELM